jgi:hypothetical protein
MKVEMKTIQIDYSIDHYMGKVFSMFFLSENIRGKVEYYAKSRTLKHDPKELIELNTLIKLYETTR